MIRKIKNLIHALEADVAKVVYRGQSKKIPTIGVTGTDGKTTTTSLIFHILKQAGYNPAAVTTVGAQIGDNEYDTGLHTTTPSAFSLQKYIKRALVAKCNYLVLEVTSHALDQNRVRGIDFKIGVLTNITHEHFDYHRTYENYIKAKSRLFKKADVAVLNRDDKSFELVKKACENKKVYSYSLSGEADFTLTSINISLPQQFEFNTSNFLAAISCAKILGVDDENIKIALSSFKFPAGRQEIVYDKDFRVVIDFAHTPNSFEKLLSALKKTTTGRLIHVFGSAGERDRSKRPLMGSVSTSFADVIVLTAEDPRSEGIEKINAQIKSGIPSKFTYASNSVLPEGDLAKTVFEVFNRQEAINFAIGIAKKGDVVVLTGKGHEKSMNLGNGEIPWNEQKAVIHALELREINEKS